MTAYHDRRLSCLHLGDDQSDRSDERRVRTSVGGAMNRVCSSLRVARLGPKHEENEISYFWVIITTIPDQGAQLRLGHSSQTAAILCGGLHCDGGKRKVYLMHVDRANTGLATGDTRVTRVEGRGGRCRATRRDARARVKPSCCDYGVRNGICKRTYNA